MRSFLQFLWLRTLRRKVELGQGLRTTLAALVALIVALALNARLPLWAVLTSIIFTQMTVGRSLKAARDYLVSTVAGALYGGAVAILIPHHDEIGLLLVLVLVVAPLAFIAAIKPNYSVATVTAIIVLLLPHQNQMTAFESVTDRILEVAIGAATGLIMSFAVLPSRAHNQIRIGATRILDLMASAFIELLNGLTRGRDLASLHQIQDGIGTALAAIHAIGLEAERERAVGVTRGPDTGPLLRTILRLRHDLVMIGRATVTPMPQELQERLVPWLTGVSEAISVYLHSSANALRYGRPPPPTHPFQDALRDYGAAVASLRGEGLTRSLPGDAAERFFALGFSLDQMRLNLIDLQRRVSEWSATAAPAEAVENDEIAKT